jgi:hypothetical protein
VTETRHRTQMEGPGARGPGAVLQTAEDRIALRAKFLPTRIRHLGPPSSPFRNPEPRTQNPEPGTQNSELRTQNSEHGYRVDRRSRSVLYPQGADGQQELGPTGLGADIAEGLEVAVVDEPQAHGDDADLVHGGTQP